jgi:transcriptional regulator with XRE-family HTH domain
MKSGLPVRMLDKEPIAYEMLEIISPDLPPHSRLYALEPIGIGTAWVESLTSYIVRLAEAHCVSTGVLFSKEIDALTGKGNIFTFRLEGNAGYSTHTINGRGVPARDFVRALESLTHRHGLRYLTLLPWEEVLPYQGGFQRRARAWCSQCLRKWQAKAMPVYEPLLWTLKPVTLCPLHQQTLSFMCPFCKLQNGVLDARTRPGHCSRCEQWLAPPPTADLVPDNRALTNDDLSWGNWVATVLGEILAAAPRLPFVPRREGIAQTIRLCVEHIADGNASEFARALEVGRGDVSQWQLGKALPKFPSLLGLSFRLGISLLELITGASDSVPQKFIRLFPSQLSKRQFTSRRPRKPLRRMDSADVLHILQAALNESPPPSVRKVIKRTNHDQAVIYRYFPEECHTIAQRFADYRKIQAIARRDRARAEIREAAYQLHAKGVKITRKHLRPLLTSSDYTNLEEGRAALRKTREELQLVGDCCS